MLPRRPTLRIGFVLAAFFLFFASACSPSSSGSLAVNAASSLRIPFNELARVFSKQTGIDVALQTGPSSLVALQIIEGAPSDVFASADWPSMERVVNKNLNTTAPKVFAQTRLALAVSSSTKVKTLSDLQRSDVKIVTAIDDVPIRVYTNQALAAGNLEVKFASYEIDAKGIVEKLTSGEADAAFLYEAEAKSAGLQIVEIPDVMKVRASYYVAATSKNENADQWIDFLFSKSAQEILIANGYLTGGEIRE